MADQEELHRREIEELRRTYEARLASEIAVRDGRLAELSGRLESIERSVGWKAIGVWRRLKERLLPAGSRRRRWFGACCRDAERILDAGMRSWLRNKRGVRMDRQSQYERWLRKNRVRDLDLDRMRAESSKWGERPLFSLLFPVHDPSPDWLRRAIASVQAQAYGHWELCAVDDGSRNVRILQMLLEASATDPRIRVERLPSAAGIAGATARALAMASGSFVGFLDHDDELSPDALFEVARLLREQPDLDLVYSDEDKIDAEGNRTEPFFKPDWNPDLLFSFNYVSHFCVCRRAFLERIGGIRPGFDGSQDYDLLLRAAEQTGRIGHVPKILYHWRTVPGSAARASDAKPDAYPATARALQEALRRRGWEGGVEVPFPGMFRVRRKLPAAPLVSILIPTRDRAELLARCVRSIEEKTAYRRYEIVLLDNGSLDPDARKLLGELSGRCKVLSCPGPFNFSWIINRGAREAAGEHLLFLNNDTEVVRPGWLEGMLEHSLRPEVGAVGAKLLYPDGTIQHAGVVLGVGGLAGHAFKRWPADVPFDFRLPDVVRNCSAVTAACMMVRRSVFDEIGGFDERFRVAFNDVDFCLRLRRKGYWIVYTPSAELIHHESASRGAHHPSEDDDLCWRIWGEEIRKGDPFYNPNLSRTREDWSLAL